MRKVSKQRLVAAVMKARLRAVAPYSRFRVGAALMASSGKLYSRADVESASYGLSCCAERVAQCGACRQLLAEYSPEALVVTADSRNPSVPREFKIKSLLSEAFALRPAISRLREQSDS